MWASTWPIISASSPRIVTAGCPDQIKLFRIRLTADAGIAGDLIGTEGREGRNSYRRLTYLGCSSLRTHAPTLTYLPTLNKITNGAVVIVAPHREINMLAGR